MLRLQILSLFLTWTVLSPAFAEKDCRTVTSGDISNIVDLAAFRERRQRSTPSTPSNAEPAIPLETLSEIIPPLEQVYQLIKNKKFSQLTPETWIQQVQILELAERYLAFQSLLHMPPSLYTALKELTEKTRALLTEDEIVRILKERGLFADLSQPLPETNTLLSSSALMGIQLGHLTLSLQELGLNFLRKGDDNAGHEFRGAVINFDGRGFYMGQFAEGLEKLNSLLNKIRQEINYAIADLSPLDSLIADIEKMFILNDHFLYTIERLEKSPFSSRRASAKTTREKLKQLTTTIESIKNRGRLALIVSRMSSTNQRHIDFDTYSSFLYMMAELKTNKLSFYRLERELEGYLPGLQKSLTAVRLNSELKKGFLEILEEFEMYLELREGRLYVPRKKYEEIRLQFLEFRKAVTRLIGTNP